EENTQHDTEQGKSGQIHEPIVSSRAAATIQPVGSGILGSSEHLDPDVSDGIGLRSERRPLLLAIMVATGLVAIDSTVLATAVPSIVRDIGGFSSFPWLFSVYLLASGVTVPVYAKLADTIGRKPLILWGIGVFLLGSILCGIAWDMPSLTV